MNSSVTLAKILLRRESRADAIRHFMAATGCRHFTAVQVMRFASRGIK